MRREPTFEDGWDAGPADPHADAADGRPLDRPRPFRRLRLAARLGTAAGAIALLSLIAHGRLDRSAAPAADPSPSAAPASLAAWSDPPRAVRVASPASGAAPAASGLLRLAEGGPASEVRSLPPRWSPATGLREDGLTQGAFDAIDAPYLVVTLTDAASADPDAPGEGTASLFVTLARRAADGRGLAVARTAARGRIETKFGPLETVEATLAGAGTRACTGFRTLDAGAVRLDGWLCDLLGQAPDPRAVACLLDRVALTGPASATVEAAFDAATRRRDPACRPAEAAAGEHRADATGSIAPPPRRRSRK